MNNKDSIGEEKGVDNTMSQDEIMGVESPSSIEQLNVRLDRVNRWIENCDQKVYILLAFIGACIAVFVSSSLFLKARNVLVQPFCKRPKVVLGC